MIPFSQLPRSRVDLRGLFVTALITLTLFGVGWVYAIEVLNRSHEETHVMMDMAARQRMLSQKIALNASLLVLADREIERELLRDQIRSYVDEMGTGHTELLATLPRSLYPLMFSSTVMLDARIHQYMGAAIELANQPSYLFSATLPLYNHIIHDASTRLINDLELMVDGYREYATDLDEMANRTSMGVFVTALFAFAGLVLIFLRPLLTYRILRENDSLRISQDMSTRILNTVPGAVFICYVTPADGLMYYSDQLLTLTGQTREAMQQWSSRTLLELCHPDDVMSLKATYEMVPSLKDDAIVSMEYRIRHADGHYIWISVTVRVFQHDENGKVTQLIGLVRDISSQRTLEIALEESRRRYNELVENLPMLVFRLEQLPNGAPQFTFLSDRCEAITGIPREEALQDPMLMFNKVHPEDMDDFMRANSEAVIQRARFAWEGRVIVNGETRWHRIESTPTHRADGTVYWDGFEINITHQKTAEIELNEKNHFIERVLAMTPNLIAIVDIENDKIVYINREPESQALKVFRAGASSVMDLLMTVVHPEDLHIISKTLSEVREHNDSRVCSLEYRVELNKGTWGWSHTLITVFQRNAAGMVTQIIGINEDITARKQAEEAMKVSESRYRLLAHNFPNGSVVLFDRDLRYILADGEDMRRHGFDPQTIHGKHLREVLPPDFCDLVEPYYCAGLAGETIQFETEYQDTHYVAHVVPLTDGRGETNSIMLVTQDITARKQAENALRDGEALFKLLVNSIDDAFWMLDVQNMRYLYLSPANEAILGVSLDALSNDMDLLLTLIHPDDLPAALEARTLSLTQTIEHEMRLINQDTERWIRVRAFPILGANNTVTRVAGLAEDITDRKQVARQAVELEVERERVRVLQRFISAASHDLRTPLAVMKASFYLVHKLPNPDEREHYLHEIELQIGHLGAMIEDLLTMSRLDMRDLTIETIDVRSLVAEMVGEHRPLAQTHGHVLVFEAVDHPVLMMAAERELRRAFLNLIMNAIKYTSDGGRIVVRVDASETRCHIAICDNGIGIEAAHVPRIFDSFYRVDAAHQQGGTGLGLAITRKIIEAHGGAISVESEYGKGSTFTVELPVFVMVDSADRSLYA